MVELVFEKLRTTNKNKYHTKQTNAVSNSSSAEWSKLSHLNRISNYFDTKQQKLAL